MHSNGLDPDYIGGELGKAMKEAGLAVTVDQMGNIFGQRPGGDGLPPVMMGSHADSVPTGGKYDGQLGVLAQAERAGRAGQERRHLRPGRHDRAWAG